MPGTHAILSPSGASRWLVCTPSARLEQQFPDKGNTAASEGTLAHTLGELLIKNRLKLMPPGPFSKGLKAVHADPLYSPEMTTYMDAYAVYVIEQYNEARKITKDAVLFLEQKLNLTDYVPEGFGTGDVVIIADGCMDIIDLKYGKGVPVSSTNNKQMMLYALGALREFDFMYDLQRVRMTIYQPRLDNISIFEMETEELKAWAENELKPRAELAFNGEGEYAPGEACRFCKARAVCKANADYNMELAKYEFKEASLLRPDEVSDILSRADHFGTWINAIEEYALHEAVNNGAQWPGYKIVEGRSNRTYINDDLVASRLSDAGYKESEIFNKKIIGIGAAEKLLGKAKIGILESLIIKPQGKPTLVKVSDKRPEFNSADGAVLAFANVDTDEL